MTIHETYIHRCIELAGKAAGHVSPNPMVGAVLVHGDTIIGEGFHEIYGGPHAEVNCIASVAENNRTLISSSSLYVSLEPCAHYGKTPPCADMIIRHSIPRVYIGCRDPFEEVNGKGIEKLRFAGITVQSGILEKECIELNRRFFIFHTRHRPYIILKWAETNDGKIGNKGNNRLFITGDTTNRLVHKWRSEEAAVMVGTNTANADDPQLTNRLWNGPDPVRIVIDKQLSLPASLKVLDGKVKTIVFNLVKHEEGNILYYRLEENDDLISQIVAALYTLKIMSVLIEGGALLTQSFINAGLWDEARLIRNKELIIGDGVAAPVLKNATLQYTEISGKDIIEYYTHK